MKLLLDTHTFIWWDSQPHKLSATVSAHLQSPLNIILLSVASIWEMQIKHQLGKLPLRLPLADIIKGQQQSNGIVLLPVLAEHVLALDQLPSHHKDPFDRLLLAQANSEMAT
ncbi:MAG: type II toxin-antitoxin system VapC family toxin, partial [Acidobacteriota bacterium]|nr:type II toxin-antitoxin system VapC family toxin [Acidobacteriota bacterium]